VYVVGNGCPESRIDVARAEKYLAENGYEVKADMTDADLVLFKACGLTNKLQSNSIGIIKEIQSKLKRNQRFIVWGCLPKIDPEGLEKEYTGLVSAGSELPELHKMLNLAKPFSESSANELGRVWPLNEKNATEYVRYQGSKFSQVVKKPALRWDRYISSHFNLVRNKAPTVFYIKISSGCHNNCTFCAVRIARGLTKSKPMSEVVAEFKLGLQKGYKNFSLMGTSPGSYGVDLGYNFIDLLKALTTIDGDYNIFIRNFHPMHMLTMLDGFLEVLGGKKIKYVELAAQSGNNRILKLMNRNYTIEEYKHLIVEIRKAYPALIIRSQLMVGFPTETEADFQDTLKLLDDLVFDYVEVYEFSDRPGTVAAKLEPKVPDNVKRQRFLKLYKKAVLNRTPRKIKNILLKRM
jgi:tRNA A37 methylthiotransferase MiaB